MVNRDLIKKHLSHDNGSGLRSSAEYYAQTGHVSGSLLLAVEALVNDHFKAVETTVIVGAQFCPKCSPATYGSYMVTARFNKEQCSSCGYMVSEHNPIAISTGQGK